MERRTADNGGAGRTAPFQSNPRVPRRLMGYQCHGPLLGWYEDNPDGF